MKKEDIEKEKIEYFERTIKSAEEGSRIMQYELATIYEDGISYFVKNFFGKSKKVMANLPDVPNRQKAIEWYEKAAAQGHPGSIKKLIEMEAGVYGSAMKLYRTAMDHEEKENYDQAIADYTEAVRLYPNVGDKYIEGDAYFRRGEIYFNRGDLDAALADYDKAIELNPGYAAVYGKRAEVHQKKGNAAEAVLDLAKYKSLLDEALKAFD